MEHRVNIEQIFELANNHHPAIKFTAEISTTETKAKGSDPKTSLTLKHISSQQNLFSIHIPLLATQQQLGEVSLKGKHSDSVETRLKNIFEEKINTLKEQLIERGYSLNFIEKIISEK